MPIYFVERYLPGRDRAWLEAALARIPRARNGVVYLGSTYVPADDSCFSRFEAKSADDVRDVNEIAGVPFARIVAAAEIGVDERGPAEGGSVLRPIVESALHAASKPQTTRRTK
jgi:hypothetical protein